MPQRRSDARMFETGWRLYDTTPQRSVVQTSSGFEKSSVRSTTQRSVVRTFSGFEQSSAPRVIVLYRRCLVSTDAQQLFNIRRRPYNTTVRRRTNASLLETGWRLYDSTSPSRSDARMFETARDPYNTTLCLRADALLFETGRRLCDTTSRSKSDARKFETKWRSYDTTPRRRNDARHFESR